MKPERPALRPDRDNAPRENVVYGFHAAEEIIRHRPRSINHIWTSSGNMPPRTGRLIGDARRLGIAVRSVDEKVLSRLCGNSHHQGVVLEVSPYQYSEVDELLDVREDSLFCILDEIQDVTNFAALIRTAEGAGVQGIFIPERRSAAVTGITHRLSAGALDHVRIARAGNLARLIEEMQERGIRVICADSGASKLWHEADYAGPIAVLVGNEFKGVRRLLKEKSDELVRIPMQGKVQSLNVNVAAAILLYEALRQRKKD